MNSEELARYIEETDRISQPWLLIQLRLKKLQENRQNMSSDEYIAQMSELHQELMKLGEWWVGIEDDVFNP
ncbi:conserved hypothetical protein [Crocosphaera subtropica ATCC 51142]|uniref:Uncharacterized protein n=1 Tax=Crocosphaera subtropica (strain ATCC 51142 / BH68) TaxID=43989 RepID=B1WZM2_CROS5|nr:hypothetical protein [Crocosphaera subtropica]ACB51174.1 conserved hypothetical protein [Crocosphaera subtropica ATCC 51142]